MARRYSVALHEHDKEGDRRLCAYAAESSLAAQRIDSHANAGDTVLCSGKMPHASEQPSPCTTALLSLSCPEPALCKIREATTMRRPHTATKRTPRSDNEDSVQPQIQLIKKIYICMVGVKIVFEGKEELL